MDAARLMEFLKTEFGICSREEFELAVSQMQGINLGLFTMPFKGGRNEQETYEALRCS